MNNINNNNLNYSFEFSTTLTINNENTLLYNNNNNNNNFFNRYNIINKINDITNNLETTNEGTINNIHNTLVKPKFFEGSKALRYNNCNLKKKNLNKNNTIKEEINEEKKCIIL